MTCNATRQDGWQNQAEHLTLTHVALGAAAIALVGKAHAGLHDQKWHIILQPAQSELDDICRSRTKGSLCTNSNSDEPNPTRFRRAKSTSSVLLRHAREAKDINRAERIGGKEDRRAQRWIWMSRRKRSSSSKMKTTRF